MTLRKVLIFFFSGILFVLSAQDDSLIRVVKPQVHQGIRFTENKGQWSSQILFKAQLDGGALYLEKNALTFSFYDKIKYRKLHTGGWQGKAEERSILNYHAYRVIFEGCNSSAGIHKSEKGNDYENFFIGEQTENWQSFVFNYKRVRLTNIYEGVDYEVIAAAQGLKYNFYIQPNADAKKIRLRYEGVDRLKLKNGALILQLSVNGGIEQKPYAYQMINGRVKEVKCNYKLEKNVLSFDFPNGYDKAYELVIDPVLIFAAQSGSTADNFGMTATYDLQGNLYAGGTVFDNGYPTTLGAFSSTFTGVTGPGVTDIVISKYNATGTNLVYSTYVGGTEAEIVASLITDATGNLYLYGATSSANFPIINSSYDNSFNGGTALSFQFNGTTFNTGTDIFVSKLNPSGSALLGSTFIGGSNNDGVNYNNYFPPTHYVYPCFAPAGVILVNESPADSLQYNYGDQYRGEIQLDKNGNVYVASSTRSSNFPTVNAFQNSLNGKQDAVVFKLDGSLSNLLWSSYLGGSGNDAGYSMIVDDTLQTYVTGGTYSTNFPIVAGCYQTTAGGGKADGFLTKINATGNQILKSTYIGTSSYDQSYFVQSDRTGKIYVFGQSLGSMPVSIGAYSNPGSKQFIMRFNNQLTNLDLSTVIGSGQASLDISPSAFSVDKCSGSISLTGWGGNFVNCSSLSGMPISPGAFQSTVPNGHDFYLMVLHPNASGLKYGSYFGGALSDEHVDGGTSRINEQGVLFQSVCAGCGGNDDFPVTPGSWPGTPGNPNLSTNCNNGVFKFDYEPEVTANIGTSTISGCAALTVTLTNNSSPGLAYLWNFGAGPNDTTSQILHPIKTYSTPGTYTVKLTVIENLYCNTTASTQILINVFAPPISNFSLITTACTNSINTNNTSVGNFGTNSFSWNFGDGSAISSLNSPAYTYTANGNYNISLLVTDVNGCTSVKTQTVAILNFQPGVAIGGIICRGATTTLVATGGTSYTWSPGTSISNSTVATPQANPTVTTVYTANVVNAGFGLTCSKTLTTQVQVNPTPTTSFNFTSNPCGGGVNYFDQSQNNIVTWTWTLAPNVTSTVQNPYNFYTNGGTYTVSLITTNNFGCQSKFDQLVQVGIPPPVSVSGPANICYGNSAQLIATGGLTYSWSPGNTLDMPASSNPIASPLTSTEYSVLITTSVIVNGTACKFTLTNVVQVTQLSQVPVGAYANPPEVIVGNGSTLIYTGSPGALVTWYPLNSTTPTTGYTVTAYPDKPSTYTAVATLGPCARNVEVKVDAISATCLDTDAFVPNTFTPNSDGNNDMLLVRGLKLDEFYFAVYNRWGELVFETKDRTVGWDGKYKGRPADVGVFGWYLKVRCLNGQEAFKKGNVTLIR